MRKAGLILLLLVIFTGIRAQEIVSGPYWTDGTALTVAKHRWELGLFTASRYGISKKVEISAHPLMFFLMPQVKAKVGWGGNARFSWATEHGIFYPTMAMRLVSAKGTGGLISPEFDIPQMFAISNRVLASYMPFDAGLITVHAGISFSIKFGPLDRRTTIDMPIIYPRLAVFYNNPEFDAGIDFRGQFLPRFGWLFNVENFIVCGTEENYFMENKGVLAYTSQKQNLRIEAGCKLCFGRYPDGPRWHLLPVIDVVYALGK